MENLNKITDTPEWQLAIKKTVEQFQHFAQSFAESFNEWAEKEKSRITEMVKIGWYPSWVTFSFDYREVDGKSYDEFMIQRIDENFDDAIEEILRFCINRKDILKNAFELYKAENYTACIPLFIIQADGICDEEYGYFFAGSKHGRDKASNVISKKYDKNKYDKDKYDFFSKTVLEVFEMHVDKKANELPLTANIDSEKKNELNRHGILHGNENYLDYGTKINAYKAFSFLAFIVFSAKDLLQEKLEHAQSK